MKKVIKKIIDCHVKKSDHDNGFFIQGETWGSCFFRFMRNVKDQIWIKHNSQPNCFHTYTKIPSRLDDQVFHVYINYKKGKTVLLRLPAGGRVLGFDSPQPSGEYLNRSFLVLCQHESPDVEISKQPGNSEEDFFFSKGECPPLICNPTEFFRGRDVQHMYIDAAGYQTIPEAAGADKFDILPTPDEPSNHFEGNGTFKIGEQCNL